MLSSLDCSLPNYRLTNKNIRLVPVWHPLYAHTIHGKFLNHRISATPSLWWVCGRGQKQQLEWSSAAFLSCLNSLNTSDQSFRTLTVGIHPPELCKIPCPWTSSLPLTTAAVAAARRDGVIHTQNSPNTRVNTSTWVSSTWLVHSRFSLDMAEKLSEDLTERCAMKHSDLETSCHTVGSGSHVLGRLRKVRSLVQSDIGEVFRITRKFGVLLGTMTKNCSNFPLSFCLKHSMYLARFRNFLYYFCFPLHTSFLILSKYCLSHCFGYSQLLWEWLPQRSSIY